MVALVLLLIAVPFQVMGYSGTCTQGGDDEAVAGAVFSAPFLLAAVLLMARSWRAEPSVSYLLAGLTAAGLIVSTATIWLNVLRFGNGCIWKMADTGDIAKLAELYGSGVDFRNTLMVCFYLVVPSLAIVLARFDKLLMGWSRLRERP